MNKTILSLSSLLAVIAGPVYGGKQAQITDYFKKPAGVQKQQPQAARNLLARAEAQQAAQTSTVYDSDSEFVEITHAPLSSQEQTHQEQLSQEVTENNWGWEGKSV